MTADDYSFMTAAGSFAALYGTPSRRDMTAKCEGRGDKMLTATTDKTRVHPASLIVTVAVPRRNPKAQRRLAQIGTVSALRKARFLCNYPPPPGFVSGHCFDRLTQSMLVFLQQPITAEFKRLVTRFSRE
jgi:hypothetical protein